MKKHFILFFSIIAAGFVTPSAAQESTLLHFMRQSPQALRSNPANMSDATKFFISVAPMFGNINVHFKSPFAYSDAIIRTATDSLRINPDLPNKLGDKSRISFSANVEILSFGLRFAEKNMVTFSATVRSSGSVRFPSNAVILAMKGNDPARPLSIETDVQGTAYVETAFGYSRVLDENWKAGVRLKYLVGIAGIDSDKIHATIATDPDDYAMKITTGGIARTSRPNSAADVWKNSGFGFDAGVYYKTPIEGLEVNLSMIDWGFINWNANVENYKSEIKNGEYVFRGLEKLDKNSLDHITDTLKNIFSFEEYAGEKFSSSLPGKIFLGASYNFTPDDKVGFLFGTHALHNFQQTRFALMYNRSVGEWLSISVGNNFYTDQLWSPSMGINLHLGNVQMYLVTENINSFYATTARSFNLHCGMSITLSNTEKFKTLKKTQSAFAPTFNCCGRRLER